MFAPLLMVCVYVYKRKRAKASDREGERDGRTKRKKEEKFYDRSTHDFCVCVFVRLLGRCGVNVQYIISGCKNAVLNSSVNVLVFWFENEWKCLKDKWWEKNFNGLFHFALRIFTIFLCFDKFFNIFLFFSFLVNDSLNMSMNNFLKNDLNKIICNFLHKEAMIPN